MSRITCPDCGHRFTLPVTDNEIKSAEDVSWEVAVARLRRMEKRRRDAAITAAIRTAHPLVTVVSVTRTIPPSNPDPDRPR